MSSNFLVQLSCGKILDGEKLGGVQLDMYIQAE